MTKVQKQIDQLLGLILPDTDTVTERKTEPLTNKTSSESLQLENQNHPSGTDVLHRETLPRPNDPATDKTGHQLPTQQPNSQEIHPYVRNKTLSQSESIR